jgi:hypothetical protein
LGFLLNPITKEVKIMSARIRNALVFVLALAVLMPVAAYAEKTFEGEIVGLSVVLEGQTYSPKMMVAHAQFEPDFVLLLKSGGHYMLPDLPRDVKVKYLTDSVKVTGEVNRNGTGIKVNKLEVKKDGKYQVVWTKEMQKKAWEQWWTGG